MQEVDFVAVARKWQERWFDEKVFEPAVDSSRKKFFFTVPYPYVSGLLHVGHGRTYTNGDVIARFKRMRGLNVLWPMAFHITGTPVLAVSAKIASGDEATLKMFEEYVSIYEGDPRRVSGIVSTFSDPWKLVNYFSIKLVDDFKSMGYSLDLSRQFTTGDKEYNKFIEWQFTRFKDQGFLKQAAYPLLYCVNDKNAVGEDDIKDADTDPVEVQRFTAMKFSVEGGGKSEFVVSSTLRPDTAFGITNMFVNPAASYAKVFIESGDGKWREEWWVSRKAAEKLALQDKKIRILEEKSGEDFVGKWLVDPTGKRVAILPSQFVDAEHATGFVHSVPAHAPYDLVALEEMKSDEKLFSKHPELREAVDSIKPIGLIDLPGFGEIPAHDLVQRMKIANTREKQKLEKATAELYRAEFYHGIMRPVNKQFAGMRVAEAKDAMTAWLKKEGKAADVFECSRKAVCRCGGEVVAAVLSDQWFIDYNSPGWKEAANACLSQMLIHPPTYRKQFEDVFAWLDKRPCARRRGLGTQLPFNNEWIIESLSDSTIYMAFYTVIKNIRKLGLKPEQLTPELFDFVFLGKGGAQEASWNEIRREFLYWYPNDLRHTGIAHITNHLSFFIFAHAAVFGRAHWPRGISLNELVISEGTKMSKSKGNVVLLNDIASKVGPDVFRLYCVSTSDFGSVLDYRQKEVEQVRKALNKFVAVIRELAAFKQSGRQIDSGAGKWFLSKFEGAVKKCTLALEELRLRDYVQAGFYGLLNDFDYFTRRASEDEAASIASLVCDEWIALLAPVVPHVCEELWAEAGNKSFVSLAGWPAADDKNILPEVERQEDLVKRVVEDGRKILQVLKRKVSSGTVIVASAGKWTQLEQALVEKDAEKAAAGVADEQLKNYVVKEIYSLRSLGARKFDEFAVLSGALQFLQKELGLQVHVEREEESTSPRASKAMPLRPAIALE